MGQTEGEGELLCVGREAEMLIFRLVNKVSGLNSLPYE